MYRYTWLLWWTTTLFRIQQFHQWWKPDTTLCIQKTGYKDQNISLFPSNIPSSQYYAFSWYKDSLRVVNMLCYYNEKHEEIYSELNIIRQCLGNHTLLLINLTSHYSGTYYFESFYTFNTRARKPDVCYNVTVHSTYQTYTHTTILFHPLTSTHNSLTMLSSLTSTNLTHTAVHYAAINVKAQHDTATSHTMWIIPLVIIITIIVLICFKLPQKAWNKLIQYRYSGMLAAD